MRILPYFFITSALILASIFPVNQTLKSPPPPPTEDPTIITIQELHSSICHVASTNHGEAVSSGSGVILANGYVLTAAHVVDINSNGVLDDTETIFDIDVLESHEWIKADVIGYSNYMGNGVDLALLRPHTAVINDDIRGVYLAEQGVELADENFLIGRRGGTATSITKGLANLYFEDGRLRLTSAATWLGASGGGAFNTDHKLIGIIHGMGYDGWNTRLLIPIPSENGLNFVTTQLTYNVPIPGFSFYVPHGHVQEFLKNNNAFPEPPEIETPDPPKPSRREWFKTNVLNPISIVLLLLIGVRAYRAYTRS